MSQKQPKNTFHADLTGVLDMPDKPIHLLCVGVLDRLYCEDKIISQHRPGDYSVKQLRKKASNYLKRSGHHE